MTCILETGKLVKRYGRFTALNAIDLRIEPGVVGLLGPNGAGKSTLLSVLLGQTPASSGMARVLDIDARRKQRAIRSRVGFMPENDCLIAGLSGVGYVYYAGRLAGLSHAHAMQRSHEVLDYVALTEARYRPAEQYSAGMKQRLKLAQALVHDPDLLFLDEPTNGMDPAGRLIMLDLIRDLGRAGISVLLSSHLLPDVERVCQRVVILAGGEVLTTGDIDAMREPHPTLCSVEAVGDDDGFTARLQDRGIQILGPTARGGWEIELPCPDSQRLLFEAARDARVQLCALQPRRSSLEEMFMTALEKQAGR